jgi:hypothetical protein
LKKADVLSKIFEETVTISRGDYFDIWSFFFEDLNRELQNYHHITISDVYARSGTSLHHGKQRAGLEFSVQKETA